MTNKIIKEFLYNDTWVAPAGVTSVDIILNRNPTSIGYDNGTNSKTIIDSYGRIYSWGNASNGQLGVGDNTNRSSPVLALGNLTFSKIMKSSNAAYALTTSGALYAWGDNIGGQLGVGDVTKRSSPVAVLGGLTFQSVSDYGVTGLTTSGTLYGWGNNSSGELGLGDTTMRSSPVAVLGGLTFQNVNSISGMTIGLTTSGALYGWGANLEGQLGLGDVISRSSPVLVLGGLTFKDFAITNSGNNVFALTTAGALYAWGNNIDGQLGIGDVTNRSSPVLVLGGLTFSKIIRDTFWSSAYALTTSGTLYGWGLNINSVLGLGDVISRSSPVAVLGGLTFKDVFLDDNYSTYGITTSGQAYAWGLNTAGKLGVGDATLRSSPVLVLGGLSFSKIIGATNAAIGLTTSGLVYCWGSNITGGLGVGDITNRSSPSLVLGGLSTTPQAQTIKTTLSVTPGTSYTITLGYNATFGINVLGSGLNNTLTLSYEQ